MHGNDLTKTKTRLSQLQTTTLIIYIMLNVIRVLNQFALSVNHRSCFLINETLDGSSLISGHLCSTKWYTKLFLLKTREQ